MAERLKAGPSAKLIAQELALLYHHARFEPKVEHIPGVANQIADALSRLMAPQDAKDLPEVLATVWQTKVPPRTPAWYKTLAAEQVG